MSDCALNAALTTDIFIPIKNFCKLLHKICLSTLLHTGSKGIGRNLLYQLFLIFRGQEPGLPF